MTNLLPPAHTLYLETFPTAAGGGGSQQRVQLYLIKELHNSLTHCAIHEQVNMISKLCESFW